MKISDIRENTPRTNREAKKTLSSQKSSFSFLQMVSSSLKLQPSSPPSWDVEEELHDLEVLEEEFAKTGGFLEFQRYRKKVREIMAYLLERAYRIEETSTKTQKICQVVRIVDEKLRQIQQNLLHRRQDVVVALHLMGQIRGLLVDVLS
ncbi:MAG: DUF327 family protein [Leptospiraceae bacterium]|nr:DUF327 family protein [Leptospiraceae bacterium]